MKKQMKSPAGLTAALARLVAKTPSRLIPQVVREHAKVAFLDWLGCTLAGARHPAVGKLIRYAEDLGGRRQASLIGLCLKKTAPQAALINGTASHVIDYDDTSTVYIGHASAGMLAALLALAEWKGAGGRDFLDAHALAFRIANILGSAVGMAQYNAGWHTTSTIGHIASAAGCARLLGLGERQTAYALGLAGTLSSGLKIVFGTMAKSFHAGNACRAGLSAALLAAEGFTCAEDFYEGADGYLQVFGGDAPRSALRNPGEAWGFDTLAQKYHASCHFTHSAIESILAVVKKQSLLPEEIEAIEVYTSPLALKAAGKREPKTALEGKFSLPYCAAIAVLRNDTGLGAFTDRKVRNASLQKFMKKIILVRDEGLSPMAARVAVQATGGGKYVHAADVFREIPPLPEKRSRIEAKFLGIATPLLGARRARRIVERVGTLEEAKSLKDLVAATRF
ncbi:MAG: MmgE/PrpD family protein [Deltaproteobacteria bacterium]|nr:MmgE/PrpD family protein [Deltaproteobacteria bacterium]